MFRLLFELNRRMPNGTYGGVRGIINLYSIVMIDKTQELSYSMDMCLDTYPYKGESV